MAAKNGRSQWLRRGRSHQPRTAVGGDKWLNAVAAYSGVGSILTTAAHGRHAEPAQRPRLETAHGRGARPPRMVAQAHVGADPVFLRANAEYDVAKE